MPLSQTAKFPYRRDLLRAVRPGLERVPVKARYRRESRAVINQLLRSNMERDGGAVVEALTRAGLQEGVLRVADLDMTTLDQLVAHRRYDGSALPRVLAVMGWPSRVFRRRNILEVRDLPDVHRHERVIAQTWNWLEMDLLHRDDLGNPERTRRIIRGYGDFFRREPEPSYVLVARTARRLYPLRGAMIGCNSRFREVFVAEVLRVHWKHNPEGQEYALGEIAAELFSDDTSVQDAFVVNVRHFLRKKRADRRTDPRLVGVRSAWKNS